MSVAASRGGAHFTCLVCQRQNAADELRCPQCNARKGDNFVMAEGASPPPVRTRGDDGLSILAMLEVAVGLVFIAAGVAVLLGMSWQTVGWLLVGVGLLCMAGLWLF